MSSIHETGSRLIHSGLSELKKQIKKVVNKFSGRSVKEHKPVQNLPKSHDNGFRRRSLNTRKVSNAADPTPSSGAIRKDKAKDVLPEMIPGKVQPPPGLRDAKIGEELGSGAFGTVYTVDDTNPDFQPGESPGVLQKKYVVKDQAYDPEGYNSVSEFKSGIRKEVDLQNFDGNSFSVVQDGFFYGSKGMHHKAMMEHGGHSLDKVGLNKKSFPGVGRQFLLQLSSLHQQGILHTDIKQENVLVNHQGRVRLSDFGLAQKREGVNPDDKVFSKRAGTPLFMAPEVYKGTTYSLKADIWSAGVMFYELLKSEEFPWLYNKGAKDEESYGAFNEKEYNNLISSIKKERGFSENEKSLLLSMLALNPSERPTAEELLRTSLFQNQEGGNESYFDLQGQHRMQYQRLALLEKDLEEAEALDQAGSNEETAQKVEDLTNEVLAAGTELKYLQSKIELHDIKAEQKIMRSTLHKKMTPAAQDEVYEMKNEVNRLENDINLKKSDVQYLRETLNGLGIGSKSSKKALKAEISSLENKIQINETKRNSLQKQIKFADTGIPDKDTKKELQDLKNMLYLASRDIELKQVESQKLGSTADLLRKENKLLNEINSDSVSSENQRQLMRELDKVRQEEKVVNLRYEQKTAKIMQDYKRNKP